ncbi:MAG: arginine--tRNA ligase, partial [Candidatus Rokubacteria bacterium]|nr:arginine--tRNA ligase [Candidatus Rokubacteria bacterium]
FVSANPTGPLVIVNARAAAVGDALAHLLRAQGAEVTTEYYVNDSGNQFEALARSFRARVLQQLGVDEPLPDSGYPGEYLVDLAKQYLAEHPAVRRDRTAQAQAQAADPQALARLGRWAVDRIVDGQRRVLADYGVAFDVWTSEQGDVRDAGLPAQVIEELRKRHLTYEALEGESDDRAPARPPRAQPPRADAPALWFRASQYGDEKDRVLRKSSGEPTYFAVDIAFHHALKFADFDRVITLIGPDHHGYLARMRAALQALGHPPEAFEILIIQLVTLLRDGEPVRMSKRRGEFVLMEELLEEVGRDAARFTFLMRRHDSPLDFDLAVATRQSADNPVYYVQYAHARVRSLFRQAAEQGMAAPPWSEVILARLLLPEEQQIIKHLAQYPELVASAARALEPHRIAYWLYELAGLFHPYYKNHRVLQPDHELALARLALCAGVGRVVANGLALLGVSAPESM